MKGFTFSMKICCNKFMNFWENLEKNKKYLTPAEKKVCKILEENPYPFHTFSGSKIAEMYDVPQSSITRFVKKLGYENYADFRMDLAMSERRSSKTVETVKNSEKSVIENVSAVRQVASKSLMDDISDKLINAHHIYLMGTGNSYLAAYQMMVKLTITRIQSTLVEPGFEIQRLHSMNGKDVVIMYSTMNPTHKAFLQAVEELPKQSRPYTVLVTSTKNHPLKKMVDNCVELPTIVTPNTISQANEFPPMSFNLFLIENLVENIRNKNK